MNGEKKRNKTRQDKTRQDKTRQDKTIPLRDAGTPSDRAVVPPPAGPLVGIKEALDAAFRLAAIVDSSDDAIISKDLDGVITSWNKGAERIFGYPAAEAIGQPVSIVIPPDRLDEESQILKRIRQGERIEHYQTVRRRRDGSYVDVSLAVSPIKDASGTVIGASKVARDISEHRRDQELLRRSEELLRVTLSSIGDAVISTDHKGHVTFINGVAERLMGVSQQEAIGNPLEQCFKIINEFSRQPVANPVTKVLREGAVGGLGSDTILISRDGTERAIDDSAAPIRNAAGDLIGVVLVFRDVTERRAQEWEARRLASIVANSYDAIYSVAFAQDAVLEALFQTWNRGAEQLYGYTAQEIIGKPIRTFLPADVLTQEREILTRVRKGESVEPYETRRLTKDGRQVEVSVSASPLKDSRGRIVGVSKIARDLTAIKQAEEALRASEEQLRTVADNIAQLAWMADEKGSIFWYNKRWYEYTGTTLEDMQGWAWKGVHHPDHVDRVLAHWQASLGTGEPWEDVFPLRGKDGSYRWFLSRAQPIRDASGRVLRWLGSNTDVTEQRAVEETLRRGALHDALTDLPNRAYFLERVSQALARTRRDPGYRVAVLLLDCDGFKAVNDSLGHAAGDRLLTEIAGRLRTCVRPGDVVARLGGDEFTVLLEEVTAVSDVEHAARRIQDSLAAPLALQDREIVTTASIGGALSQPDHEQAEDLLRDADLAMYHAKQEGRARFQVFDVALRDSTQARLDLEEDLRNALEHREFRLVFQPIVELETGAPRAFEALLRWHRPKQGVVAPLDFVGLAEQTGLILSIGNWVLQEGCRHARSWQDAFPAAAPVRISVNLSAKQLLHPDIVGEVRTTVENAAVAPSCLIFEIAERVLMENVESSKAVLHQLREVGVDVHMDDFGTGPSSLSSLSRFPLQGIKLDRSLVHRMGTRRTDLEIVRSMVDLAKSLGLGVIAEGVETVAQRERLIAFGCELGQGHLFAKPFEAKAAASFRAKSEELARRSA